MKILRMLAVAGLILTGAALGVNTDAAATLQPPTKVLTFVVENHSYNQMRTQMPYLNSLASQYAYATAWTAITHPSLPNYLAIAGGSTFGVTDDADPSSHHVSGQSIFGQALAVGKRAKTYAESMPGKCYQTASGTYGVKHNPWAYFTDTAERAGCNQFDVGTGSLLKQATNGRLPNVGMVIPNNCHSGHSATGCPNSTAGTLAAPDDWLKTTLPTILGSADFTSGRLVVVVTADEDDYSSGNTVLTVVMQASLSNKVVTTALTHYSLTRYYAQVLGVTPLRGGVTAPDMKAAFGL